MTRRTWGLLAGIAGSALGAWYFRSRTGRRERPTPGRAHGTVIFDNTPTAADVDALI